MAAGEHMPQLKAVYDSKDAVPEAQRDLYVEHEGKFVLDAEGVQDVGGLKSALDRLKAERKDLMAQAEKFKGVDPDK